MNDATTDALQGGIKRLEAVTTKEVQTQQWQRRTTKFLTELGSYKGRCSNYE